MASAVRVRQDRDDGAQRPARDETYAWLGNLPTMREWIGPRVAGSLSAYGFTIANRTFESTVSVAREDIEDDRPGTAHTRLRRIGQHGPPSPRRAGLRPAQERVHLALADDGQFFFDTDHPVIGDDGETVTTVANTDGRRILGVKQTVLVVPPSLEEAALMILNSEYGPGGETNPWKGTASLIVAPWLA